MNPKSTRPEGIFAAALDIADPQERRSYVDHACAGDEQLRLEVESLLAAHAQGSTFMERPAPREIAMQRLDVNPDIAPSAPLREKPGDRIGRYKLLEQIGEGGFGVVWMAEQEEPVRRRVALKVIKLGMDTHQVVARFEAERQALALMDHPNIARVFDGGATESGRPYFVMELVRGIPITEYCDAQRLSTAERLQLFTLVCQAVQHAHQKGVIHRDLKPSNILVTELDGKAVPKVIDFGVAKATQARLTEKTLFTQFHQLIGTPNYMSPEQAGLGGLDVDTRSDIYSMGVVLYELLTGRTPFDTRKLVEEGYEAILRTIREEEPIKPSTRLSALTAQEVSAVASKRRAEPARLNHLMRGDLDWIVMKCLEKNRQRRYETANGLAGDLQRHLSQEPVIAAPPSMGYRLQRFGRRHRLALATGGAFLIVLLGGTAASLWQSWRAQSYAVVADQQRQVAKTEAARANGLLAQSQKAETELEHSLYRSRVQLAFRSWQEGKLTEADQLLNDCREQLRHWEWFYLKHLCHAERFATSALSPTNESAGHSILSLTRMCVAFNTRGDEVARVSQDKGITSWDSATGRLVNEPVGQAGDLERFSQSHRLVAVRNSKLPHSDIEVMDVFSRRKLCNLRNASLVAFAAGDQTVAAIQNVRSDNLQGDTVQGDTLRIYSLETGKELCAIQHPDLARCQALAVSGEIVAAASERVAVYPSSSEILIWSLSDGRLLHKVEGLNANLYGGFFELDTRSETLVAAEKEGRNAQGPQLNFVDVGSGKLYRTSLESQVEVSHIGFHPREKQLIVSLLSETTGDSEVRIFDTGSSHAVLHTWISDEGDLGVGPRLVMVWTPNGNVPVGPLFGACDFALSPDGSHLAAASLDGMIRLWDTQSGKLLIKHRAQQEALLGVAFSPDGARLASVSASGVVRVWDALAQAGQRDAEAPYNAFTLPARAAISENGEVLLAGNRVWRFRAGCLLELPFDSNRESLSPDGRFVAHENQNGVAITSTETGDELAGFPAGGGVNVAYRFNLEGNRLALVEEASGRIEVWQIPSGSLIFKPQAPRNNGHSLGAGFAFSQDGAVLANTFATGEDGRTRVTKVWNVTRGQELFCATNGAGHLRPDGKRFVQISGDVLEIVDLENGHRQVLSIPEGHSNLSYNVSWSPQHEWLLCSPDYQEAPSAAPKCSTYVCNVARGTWALVSPDLILQPTWSHDGKRLATLGRDFRLTLWDVESWAPILTLNLEAEWLRFSQDGQYLSAISPQGWMRVLDGTPLSSASPPCSIPPPVVHQRSTRTAVEGLQLAAFLEPGTRREAENNSIRVCALFPPYAYVVTRNGQLWTFALPESAPGSETIVIHPLPKTRTVVGLEGAIQNDLCICSNILLVSCTNGVKLFGLNDPADPPFLGDIGLGLSAGGGQFLLDGERLYYFGRRYSAPKDRTGFLACFDMANPRQPKFLGATNFVDGIACCCVVDKRLVLLEDVRGEYRQYELACFDVSDSWPPRFLGRIPSPAWFCWLLPAGGREILATGDFGIRKLRINDAGLPEFDLERLPWGGRSAVFWPPGESQRLVLQGAVLKHERNLWQVEGCLPEAMQRDGYSYRAAVQGPFVAIPGDDRVWLYKWTASAQAAKTVH